MQQPQQSPEVAVGRTRGQNGSGEMGSRHNNFGPENVQKKQKAAKTQVASRDEDSGRNELDASG